MPLNFFRLNHPDEASLAAIEASRGLAGADPDGAAQLAPRLRAGDHILVGRWDAVSELGLVRLVGRVATAGESPVMVWVRADVKLRPRSFGKKFWATNPQFRFDDAVSERYMLTAICEEAFVDVEGAPPMPADTPSQRTTGSAAKGGSRAGRPDRDDPGHVYLISSPHGYKIGKSRRLPDRLRLFGVKLPFPIELVAAGWCADHSAEEARLHAVYHAKRLEGEWFALDPADVEALRRRLCGREPGAAGDH